LLRKRDQFDRLMKQQDTTADMSYRAQQIQKLEMEVAFAKENYLDYSEKLKEAEWEANNKKPLFLVTEKSLPPIDPYRPSPKLAAIKGAFYGSALIVVLLLAWKMYSDLVAEFED
ncbi:MAG: hypothetical protein AAGD05_02945, partial [Bacteroidota bacterium]